MDRAIGFHFQTAANGKEICQLFVLTDGEVHDTDRVVQSSIEFSKSIRVLRLGLNEPTRD
jgi:hypothetical protein